MVSSLGCLDRSEDWARSRFRPRALPTKFPERRESRFDGEFGLLAGPSIGSPEGRKTLETRSKLHAPGRSTRVQTHKCSKVASTARLERFGEPKNPSNLKGRRRASCASYEKSAITVHLVSPI